MQKARRAARTPEQKAADKEQNRLRYAKKKADLTREQLEAASEKSRLQREKKRAAMTAEQLKAAKEKACLQTAQRRANETVDEHETRLAEDCSRIAQRREDETFRETERVRAIQRRAGETVDEHEARLAADCSRITQRRADETVDEHDKRLAEDCSRNAQRRADETVDEHAARLAGQRSHDAQARENERTETEERLRSRHLEAHVLRSAPRFADPPSPERVEEILRLFQANLDEPVRACIVCDEFCYSPREIPLQDLFLDQCSKPSAFVRALHNYCSAPTGAVHAAHTGPSVDSAPDVAGPPADDEADEDQAAHTNASTRSALARSKKFPPGQRWLVGPEVPPLTQSLREQYNCTTGMSPADQLKHAAVGGQLSTLLLSPGGVRCNTGPCDDRQVVASVCGNCHNALSRDQIPTNAIANGNWIGYLPSMFDDTTPAEYSLVKFVYRVGGRFVTLDGGRGHSSLQGHMHHLFRDAGVVSQM